MAHLAAKAVAREGDSGTRVRVDKGEGGQGEQEWVSERRPCAPCPWPNPQRQHDRLRDQPQDGSSISYTASQDEKYGAWPRGQSGSWVTAAGPRPARPSVTLGLVRAPGSLIRQDVRSGLGVGAWSLKWGPRGSSWTEGSGAQERQIWVSEGCQGPRADQSQVSWGGGHQRSGGRSHGWSCSWGRG